VTGLLQSIITIVLFILILGVLVVIHELGHFVTARLANVRVLEFGVGFPPRAKVLRVGPPSPADVELAASARSKALALAGDDARRRDEILDEEPATPTGTVYTLNWLPIGGFVKLDGEDGDGVDDPRSFAAKSWPTKMLILVAGVAMNIALAFVIFTGIALGGDPTIGITIGTVEPGSPAAVAGIEPGDTLVSIDGEVYGAFSGESLLADLRANAGQTVQLGIETADGSVETITVTLRTPAEISAQQGALGVGDLSATTTSQSISYSPAEAVAIGAQRTADALGLIWRGLGELASSIVEDPTQPPPVAGPVGIATQIGDVFWQLGPIVTLYVAGILSANLAVVNILPFPPLDGGRMLMITLKRLFGARISLRAEQLTYMVGFVFLFAFLIWITGFDIIRSLSGGS